MTSSSTAHSEPRSRAICRHTELALRRTGLTRQAFACKVVDEYVSRVVDHERIVEFAAGTTAESIEKANIANDQKIRRYMDGSVNFPVDLEEAWIAALPQPHRTDCERELAHRYGFLGARAQMSDLSASALCIAEVAIEAGHVMQAHGHIMADGVVTAEDLPALDRLEKECKDLAAAVASLEHAAQEKRKELLAAASSQVRAIR